MPPLFDSDFLAKLEYLSLVSRRVFRGSLLAQRRTMQLGGGIEFADHRDYSPGDDFRYLDWNLYARHDELLLKRFQEEEDLHVYFLLDVSTSMAYGSPSKFDMARRITAALAYIALADLDRIAVSAFARDVVEEFPLTRGKARILSLLDFLRDLTPRSVETDLARSAKSFVHRARRRGLVVVVSDLYDPAGFERGLDLLRHHRHEPHIVQIHDRTEVDPTFKGDVELVDVETGLSEKVTVDERRLARYREAYDRFQESIATYARTHGLGCTRASTDTPLEDLILKMMRSAGALR
ncbi:MAG: DUF58 domain-containing protein [Isosphaeraceae bacterium]|nr:DUF58 domain-containing protein [Isosphaeraceae bacterium]